MKVTVFGTNKPDKSLPRDAMLAWRLQGAIGFSNHYGWSRLGLSHYGDDNPMNGIYQAHSKGYNNFTGPPATKSKKTYYKRMSFTPYNPQTVRQQAWRAVFTAGVQAWHDLTDEQRYAYNKSATRKSRLGFTSFVSNYLRANRLA